MSYSYGAQPAPTNTGYSYGGAAATAVTPPPIPAGNPYASSTPFQQMNMASPMMYWQQLGYGTEPTLVDIISDLIRDNEDAGTFFAEGGFDALSHVVSETVDRQLKQFFSELVFIQQKGEDGVTTMRFSLEQSGEGTKAIINKSQAELTTAIQVVSTSVKEKLLEPKKNTANLHRQAASAQAASSAMGMFAESMNQPNGVASKAAGGAATLLRATLGLPPAQQQR